MVTKYQVIMIENILYVMMGFAITFLSLELGWHFTACRLEDKKLRPCVFKEIKTVMVAQTSHTRKVGARY